MRLFSDYGYYEVVYENTCYEFLEFIRLDTICEVTYVTLKNIITGEMFTFNQEQIKKIRKRMYKIPSIKPKKIIRVAGMDANSL